MGCFRFGFEECFEACFAGGYARVRFAAEHFPEDALPGVDVCAHVVEFCAVYLQVQRRIWWSVEDGVEGDVSA